MHIDANVDQVIRPACVNFMMRMVMYRLITISASLSLLAACAPPPAPTEKAAPPAPAPAPAPAQPGVQQVLDEQATWNAYNCAGKKLPFVTVEENRITPAMPAPGEEFKHEFVYAACTEQAKPITGVLTRRIYYQNRLVFEDEKDNFELRPGKWDVTARIKTSPKAKPGDYRFQLSFSSPAASMTQDLPLPIRK